MRQVGVFLGLLIAFSACRGPTWQVGPGLLVTKRQVATALHDPVDNEPETRFDPDSVPDFPPPGKVRPCCPFGQDLKVKVGVAVVPGYKKENIIALEEIGHHEYDNGALTVQTDPKRGILLENNGLIYTCRGGFVDLAHVRDYADLTLYLTMRLARSVPLATTIELPDQGTKQRIVIKALPQSFLGNYGRWYATTALAGWIAYQISIWHEVVTWYDWQSVKGFSEKLSAFSPEDLYSNVVGISMATGIIRNQLAQSRDAYNRSVDAWLPEVLRRLSAVSWPQSREAMASVDGLWWSSEREMPDWLLVTHRNFETKLPLSGWLVSEAPPPDQVRPSIAKMCENKPEPLELELPERVGPVKFSDYATVEFEFTDGWMPQSFPFPRVGSKVVTQADLPTIIAAIRKEAQVDLGPGFDKPRATPKSAPADPNQKSQKDQKEPPKNGVQSGQPNSGLMRLPLPAFSSRSFSRCRMPQPS